MATQDPDLAEVIEAALDIHQSNIYTMLPGRVESFDKASGTADVQPLVANVYQTEDGARVAERHPVHPDVPVAFPRGAGMRLVWTLKPGDTVMLVYASRSMTEWRTSNDEAIPADDRRNHLSDPVAYPGLSASAFKYIPSADVAMSIGADDGDVVIDLDLDNTQIRLGKDAAGDVVVQSALDDFRGALAQAVADTSSSGPAPDPTSNKCLTILLQYLLAIPGPYSPPGAPTPVTGWKAGTTITKAK